MTETCDFASGRSQSAWPLLRMRVSSRPEPMRKHDRRRHQLRRVVAGKAEHQTLIARALLGRLLPFRLLGVDALGDVGRLAVMMF